MYLSNPDDTFKRLDSAIARTKSEQSAVNEIMRTLAALGMSRAQIQSPEVYETRYDGSVLRIYVWRDTPYKDDVVLCAGPSFASRAALGKSIPASNEVDLFIRGVLLDRRKPRALASADKTLDRAESRAAKAAEKEAAKAARAAAPRGRRRKTAEAAADVDEVAAQATAEAVQAAEVAQEAAAEAKEAKRRGRSKKTVQAAQAKAEAAAEVAQEAAAVAQEAAVAAVETAPDDAEADAQLAKLMKALGL